jgi:hypothetical protein
MEAATDWAKVVDFQMDTDPRYGLDAKLYVQFYSRPVLHNVKSDLAGRPVYIDVDHVKIIVPGDKLSIIDRVASGDDKKRFAAHWDKYKAGKGEDVIGTRLEGVAWMTRSKVEEYKFFGIHTVEQLSEASDGVGQKFPGFYADRDKAKKFLEESTGTNARVAELERQLAEMQTKMLPVVPKEPEPEVKKGLFSKG